MIHRIEVFISVHWAGQGNMAQMNPGNTPLFGQMWEGEKHSTPSKATAKT